MLKIPCTLMRVGTSKALFIQKKHLPERTQDRDRILLKLLGTPHEKQIDGLGTGDIIFSKVAIVSQSKQAFAAVDFLFVQVMVNEARVSVAANCGNVLSGVAPFAIDNGLIDVDDALKITTINIYNENTGDVIAATVPVNNGHVCYDGDAEIAGVPGRAAPIELNFTNTIGKTFGNLFPTGAPCDDIDGTPVSLIDAGIPVMLVHAHDLQKSGCESKIALENDKIFLAKLMSLREKLLAKINLNSNSLLPKIAMLSQAQGNAHLHSTYFTPHSCHATHAITGALSVASACFIKGTIAQHYYAAKDNAEKIFLEHFAGNIAIDLSVKHDPFTLQHAKFLRTARPLLRGTAILHDE